VIRRLFCHSERSEESECAWTYAVGKCGFFAALRMTTEG